VFNKFLKYHEAVSLHFSAEVGKEDICKLTILNESLHEISIETESE
jgi:hypothetical protein